MWNPLKSLTFGAVVLCLSDHWSTYTLSSQHTIYALDLFLNSVNLSSVCVSSSSAKSETVPNVFISGSVGILIGGSGGTAKSPAIVITTSTKCLYNCSEDKVLPALCNNSHPNPRHRMRIWSFTAASINVSLSDPNRTPSPLQVWSNNEVSGIANKNKLQQYNPLLHLHNSFQGRSPPSSGASKTDFPKHRQISSCWHLHSLLMLEQQYFVTPLEEN